MGSPATTLFLCPHNAAKSLLAVADFNRMAADRGPLFRADSTGTEPAVRPVPSVVAALRPEGVDVSGCRPRPVTAEDTVGAARALSLGGDVENLPASPARLEGWDDVLPVSQDRDRETARRAIQQHPAALPGELAGDDLARLPRPGL